MVTCSPEPLCWSCCENQEALLADPEAQEHLTTPSTASSGSPSTGVYSIANAVDEALPGGLAAASEADVKLALASLLADDAPTSSLRFLLSTTSTTREPTTIGDQSVVVWESPAFFARVVYDFDTFDPSQTQESFGDDTNLDAETWLRGVQTTLRGDQVSVTAIGVAMDMGLVSQEQSEAASPYLLGAVALIVILVGALLRSYWAAMIVAGGLGRLDDAVQRLQRPGWPQDELPAADHDRPDCPHQLRRRLLHPRQRAHPRNAGDGLHSVSGPTRSA